MFVICIPALHLTESPLFAITVVNVCSQAV